MPSDQFTILAIVPISKLSRVLRALEQNTIPYNVELRKEARGRRGPNGPTGEISSKVLAYLIEHGKAPAKEVAPAIGVTPKQVHQAIQRLKGAEKVKRVGFGIYAATAAAKKEQA